MVYPEIYVIIYTLDRFVIIETSSIFFTVGNILEYVRHRGDI